MTPNEFVDGLANAGYPFANDVNRMIDITQILEGQGEVTLCQCGQEITEYGGEWYHVFNPALMGTDDHDAEPEEE